MAGSGDRFTAENMNAARRMNDFVPSIRPATPGEKQNAENYARQVERPTGQEVFEQKSKAEQDEMLGEKTADLVRAGTVTIAELRATGRIEEGENFIYQRAVSDLPET